MKKANSPPVKSNLPPAKKAFPFAKKEVPPAKAVPLAAVSLGDILKKIDELEKRMATIDDLEALNSNLATYLSNVKKGMPDGSFEEHLLNLEKHTESVEELIQNSSAEKAVTGYLRAVTQYMKQVIAIEGKLVERQDAIHTKLDEIKTMLAGKR